MHIDVENFGNSSSKVDPHEHNEGGQVGESGWCKKHPHQGEQCWFGEISATFRFGTTPPIRGRPNAHEHNKGSVGPHSGSVIWALWRFKSPFAERASPLHLFHLGFAVF
jgi:hypothetical protein